MIVTVGSRVLQLGSGYVRGAVIELRRLLPPVVRRASHGPAEL
jgi:hypothetical protein